MSRTTARRGTKTKVIATAKKGATKSRYARTWKRDGKYQKVDTR